jgi:hypothetical protein
MRAWTTSSRPAGSPRARRAGARLPGRPGARAVPQRRLRYKHFWLREMPPDLQDLADVRRFGTGERIVPQPYTREMYDRTYRWMQNWDLVDAATPGSGRYEQAVIA